MTNGSKAVSKIFIKGSIQDVWRELTKTGEAQKSMFNSVMHTTGLRPGAKIQMRSINGKYVGVVGEVLEIDPPYRFSHTFKFTNYDDPYCKVTYKLKEVDGGVEFTLISEDMPAGTKTESQMTSGGDMIVGTMKNIIETGKPSFPIRMMHVMIALMAPFTPAKCRVEEWPLDDARPSRDSAQSAGLDAPEAS